MFSRLRKMAAVAQGRFVQSREPLVFVILSASEGPALRVHDERTCEGILRFAQDDDFSSVRCVGQKPLRLAIRVVI